MTHEVTFVFAFILIFIVPLIIGQASKLAALAYLQAPIFYAAYLLFVESNSMTTALLAFIGLEFFVPIYATAIETISK